MVIAMCVSLAALPSEADAQSRRDRRRAEQLVAQGDTQYRQRNYQAAIVNYARALAIVPQYPLAHFNKGSAHFNLQQYDESISEFTMALDQGYDSMAIYGIRWRANFALKNWDAAMNDVRAALGKDAGNDYFYIAQGQILHGQKDYRGAISSYQRAIDLGTKNGNVYYLKAMSHNGVGEWTDQEAMASKALSSATSAADLAWLLLGDAQQRLRKYDDAIRSYENAKSVNPDLREIYVNLAETLRVQNRLREAVLIAQEGIEKFPEDPTLHINLGWYYSLSNRNPLAIEYSRRATELDPNQYLGFTNLCRAYNDTGELQLALQNCNRALQLRPGDGETHFYLGRTYGLLDQPQRSQAEYKKAVEGLETFAPQNPNYADGYYLLGNAYSVTGQYAKAIDAYNTAIEIAPLFARARFNLGLVYLRESATAGSDAQSNAMLEKAREQANSLANIDAQLAKNLREAINQ